MVKNLIYVIITWINTALQKSEFFRILQIHWGAPHFLSLPYFFTFQSLRLLSGLPFPATTLLFILQDPYQRFLSILTNSLRQESISVLEVNLFLPYCFPLSRNLPYQTKYLKAKNHVIFICRPNTQRSWVYHR